jgi:lipopolysaccharide transport system ATP-binding protein
MSDILITVENLSKSYLVGHQHGQAERYTALRDVIVRNARDLARKTRDMLQGRPIVQGDEVEEFWALKDVSFEVKRGETLGIIGRNGAGKSTLLKILSRITEPTKGRVILRGRVASLLEVGTGFHPELTGRENIYLNGAILGMTRAEIRRKFDEIVDFAEVERFLDTPVKRYSSGMYVRLAFAVAAHLEPEILVVDEVLAVGDAQFQKKCLGKMGEVAQGGKTILFVSHNMGAIRRLCARGIIIKEGFLCKDNNVEEIISYYLSSDSSNDAKRIWCDGVANKGVNEFLLNSVSIKNENGETTNSIDAKKSFFVEIEYQIIKKLPFCRIGFSISNQDGVAVFATYDTDQNEFIEERLPGHFISRCQIPGCLFNTGRFIISFAAGVTGYKTLVHIENVLQFDIVDTGVVGSNLAAIRIGVIRPQLDWTTCRCDH